MKKIKITEKQAKLLETLNSKKVLKVTKEQYNRIIESELNRPSLTETPELHEEEINEDLFREFVNELYGINEEGAECKYEKLNKVMEAAGLIEGGKLVKEKFGKDARKVKVVVGKGLMKYEECGSVYEAVQCMEEAINRAEPEVGSAASNSRRDTMNQLGYDPDKGKYGSNIETLINDIKTIAKNNEDESLPIISDFLKIRSASKVSNLRERDLKELLSMLQNYFVDPNQTSIELDEREHLGGKRAVGLDILNIAPFSELPETRSDMGHYTTRMELRLPSLTTGDAAEIIFSKSDLIGSEFQGPKMMHKYPGYIKIFKSKFGSEPVFVNITNKGADIDENLSPKFRDWKESYINAKKSYLSDLRDKGNSGLDEMDSGALANAQIVGPLGSEKPTFKSNVPEELEEARTNLKDVVINIPDEDYLRVIKRTPTFRNYFNDKQLENLHVGDNKLTVNHTVYGKMKSQYPEGRTPFGLKNESELTEKIYEALKKKVISEMDLATLGNYQYPTPGFEDVKMKGNHPKGKGKTFKKPAIKGGKFVKVNEKCKTFPYCNQGDMGALQLTEGLKLQHDKKNNLLVVISDLEGKAGSSETYKNRPLLKSYGFEWVNGAWTISSDKLDVAKKALSTANKVDYLIDKLDDLDELIDGAANTDKKGLLKAKLEQYISDLANATDERAVSAEIKRYLTFFAKFHQYSFSNRILVYIQRPDATKVASFTTWKSKNRKIKQGAKGILILRPLFDDKKVASLDLTDLEKLDNVDVTNNTSPRTYKAEHVFDISDTEPMNEKGEIPAQPKWWGDNEPSETADDLFEAVKLVATKLGIKVTASDAKGGEKGYSAGGHINLTSDVEGAGRVSTMVHELAHELMHWKDKSKFYIGDEHKSNKALLELQAESVSYTVLAHYDIPTQHHATYLALWKANKETIERNLKIISEVSQFIVNEIDKVVDEQHIADDEGTKTRVDEIINEMVNNLN